MTIISISIPKRNSRTLVEIRGLRGPPNEVFHCPLAKSIGCVYPPMVKRNASRTNWMTIVNILPNLVVASLSQTTTTRIRYPKEIMKMEQHFSGLQRWLQILILLSGLITSEVQSCNF